MKNLLSDLQYINHFNPFYRDVLAAGGVDYALRHHEKSEDKKHPEKNHDHKMRDAVLAGGVGLGLHEHDKHKREKAQNEEAARREKAMATSAAPATHNAHSNHSQAAPAAATATGAGVAAGAANYSPTKSHARSLKTKGKLDSFFGSMFCSHSLKMKGIQRQQAASHEYQQVTHLREAERLQGQANAHARAAGVA